MSRRNSKTSILQRKGLAGRLISVLLIMTMVLAMMPSAVWAADVLAETSNAAQVETEQEAAEQTETEPVEAEQAADDAVIEPAPAEDQTEDAAEPAEEQTEDVTAPAEEQTENATTSAENAAIMVLQTLINALPDAENITAENAENVKAQLAAIDEAKINLSDDQLEQVDTAKYMAAVTKLDELAGQEDAAEPETLEEGAKAAGASGNCTGDHTGWIAWTEKNKLPDTPGQYYLTNDVDLYTSSVNKWQVPGTTTICLNGHSIVSMPVSETNIYEWDYLLIQVGNGATLNLHDCQETGHIVRTDANYGAVSVFPEGVFNMYGGTISGSNIGVYIDHDHGSTYQRTKSGRFNMYGGTIENCANGAVWVDSKRLPDGGFYFYGGDVDGTIILKDVEGNNLNTVHVCGSSDTPLQINPYNEQPVILDGKLEVPLQFHRLQGENVSGCLVEPVDGYTLTAEDALKITVVNGSHDKNIIPVLNPDTKEIELKEVKVLGGSTALTLDPIVYGQKANEANINGKVTIDDTTELAGRFWIDDETVYNAGTYEVTVNFRAMGRTDTLTYTANLTVNQANPTLAWADDKRTQTVARPRVEEEFIPPTTNSDGVITYAYHTAGAADTDTWTKGLPTECGAYEVMASVSQTTNYNAANSTNTVILTILDVPEAPTITGVNLSDGQAEVTWDTPTDPGSSPITGYEVKWLKDGVEVKTETLGADVHSATFTLADETEAGLYTCVVAAKNDTAGRGAEAKKEQICISMNPVITGVSIGHSFSKESYVEGETLDPNDLTLYLTYNYGYSGQQEVTMEKLDNLGVWFNLLSLKPDYSKKDINYKTYPLTLDDNPSEVHLYIPTGLPGESFDCYLGDIAVGKAYPGPPQNLNAKPGDQKLIVTWEEPTITYGKEITGYTIVCKDKEGNRISTHQVDRMTHELTLTGLTNGETYSVEIRARNENGDGDLATIEGKPSAYATIRITPHATLTFGEKIDEVSQKSYIIDNRTNLASLDGLSVEFESEVDHLEDGDSLEVTFDVTMLGESYERTPRYTVEPEIKVLGPGGTEKTNHNYTFITEITDLEYLKRNISDAHGFLGDGLLPLPKSQPYGSMAKDANNIWLRLNDSTDSSAFMLFPNGKNIQREIDYTISFLDANREKIESVVLPGEYTIIATGIGLCTGEYCAPFTITKKVATITAHNQTVTYGDAIVTENKVKFPDHGTYDEVQQVTLTPSGLDVGAHTITPSDAHIWNSNAKEDRTDCYIFKYATGNLTIEKANNPTIAFKEASINMEYNNGDPIPNPTEDMLTFTGAYYKDICFEWQDAEGKALASAPTGTGSYKLKAYLEDNKNHGAAEATADVTVVGRKLTKDNMILSEGPFIYSGTEQEPSVTVKDGETVIDASGYSVTYENNINAGTATVTVTDGDSNDAYEISGTLTFTIAPKNVTNPAIELEPFSYEYDGLAKEPGVTVKDGDTLIDDSEYTVEYSNNINVGTNATVTITNNEGGNYIVNGTKTFEITKSSLTAPDVTVTLTGGPYTYDGTQKVPTVTVEKNGKLVNPNEYIISYSNTNGREGDHTSAGTVTVTVTASENGNYTGSNSATFIIAKAAITDISAAANSVNEPKARETVQNTVVNGTGYNAAITWNPTDNTYGFNTEYTATLTLTPDENHVFGELNQGGWNVKVGEDGTATLTKTFSATRKEKIESLDAIGNVTLPDHTNKAGAIAKLPTTVNATTESGNIVSMTLNWSCDAFDTAPNAANTFNWKATAGDRYDASGVTLKGSITVTNPGALPVSITGTDKEATYSDSTIDVSQLFELDEHAGTASYSITVGTGEGTLSGSDLTVTKVGTFTITVQTEAKGIYAAGEASATLTVNPKAVTPKIAGDTEKIYDGNANAPAGLSIELDGLVNGDAVTASADYSYDSSAAGDRTITATNITLSGDDSGNYVLSDTQVTAAGKITKKAPVITFGNQTITYGGKPKDATADSNGTFTYSYVNKENAADTGGGWPVNAGTYTVTATVAETDNYQSGSAFATVTINRKDVTVSITANGGVYNGESFPASAELEGEVDSDNVNVTLTYTKEGEATGSVTAPANAGNYTVTATITDSNYALTGSNSKDFTISPKELTVNVTVNDKEYDGLNTATIQSAELVGVANADAGKITLEEGTPTFSSDQIGTHEINFTAFSLNGDGKENYTLIQPTGVKASITSYEAVKGRDYTVNSNDWLNQDFVVTASEGYLISTTNAADGPWEKSLTATDETDSGSLTFYVKKASGAISEAVTEEYKIDKTAPTIMVSGNLAEIRQEDRVTLTLTAGPSGITKVEAKKDDGAYTDITESYANGYEVTENGAYIFRITNGAGVTAEESITYSNLDSTEPVIKIDAVTESGDVYTSDTWTNEDITLKVENTAANLGDTALSYKIDDGPWQPYTDSLVIDKDCNAAYTFKAVSASGVEREKTIVVKCDTAAPTGAVTIGEDPANTWTDLKTGITFDQTFSKKQAVTLDGADQLSEVDSIEYILADKELSEDELSTAAWTKYDTTFFIEKNGKYVVYVKITDKAGNEKLISSDGIAIALPSSASYPAAPVEQKPAIEVNDGAQVKLDSAGTTAEITVEDGYEIEKITVNGVPVEITTKLTGLKAGDKIVVTTRKITEEPDDEERIESVKMFELVARSKMSSLKGKKAVKVYWYDENGADLKEFGFDGYEIWRSTKRYSGYGKKPFFTTTNLSYYNSLIEEGEKYYYKVRAYIIVDGKKYYTDWSLKAWRQVE